MVEKNKYGYYNLVSKPSETELANYYQEKYYQDSVRGYEKEYSDEEIRYFNNKIEEKFFLIESYRDSSIATPRILDVGCGEGWVLKFFKNKGWEVVGLDYSSFGCTRFNNDCAQYLRPGDIYHELTTLIAAHEKFDVVWLDNVLEHVLDPESLVQNIRNVALPGGLLLVEVPNDFSRLQNFLMEREFINREFWVAMPDHISYFNKEGLENLLKAHDWRPLSVIADYPIDWNLLNSDSNYVMDKSKGKACHMERVIFENLLHEQPLEKITAFYKALADLGMGRQLVALSRLE